MAWNSIYAGFVLALVTNAEAMPQGIICPWTLNGNALTEINLYDGPAAEITSLVPDGAGWSIDYPPLSPKGFHVGCRYQGASVELEFRLPSTTKWCRVRAFDKAYRLANIVCG